MQPGGYVDATGGVALWFLVISAAFAGGDPAVHVTWKANQAQMHVRAPEGEHVAPDAPFDLDLAVGERTIRVAALGDVAAEGVPLGDVRGRYLSGRMAVSLCEDGGSQCRLLDVRLAGQADDRKRGSVALVVRPADATGEPKGFPAQVDASVVFEQAVQRARTASMPVLLDFGAVWCPPCNLMDAEVFEADPAPAVVDAFVLAKLDVDDPSSWDLKDRYEVGGYPTVIAIDAEGAEIGRMVGYRGRDATVNWLDAVATGRVLRRAGDPTPRDAAQLAWDAVQAGRRTQAVPLLEIAAADPDHEAYRLAKMALDPTLEDAQWLVERAPGRAIDWVSASRPLWETVEGRELARRAIQHDLTDADPLQAADLLFFAADLADTPTEAKLLYGAAAALVRGELNGKPEHDKGHYEWLAYLTELAGRPSDAVDILTTARDAFPQEPTFHTYLGRTLLRMAQPEEALAAAEEALAVGWGDNKLTAARVAAEALIAMNRRAEAQALVHALLAAQPEPATGVDVRTHRYRKGLLELVDGHVDE